MDIRHIVNYRLRPYLGKYYQIRIRVSYYGQRHDFVPGYNLLSTADWDPSRNMVREGSIGCKGAKWNAINAELLRYYGLIEDSFKYFEVIGEVPTVKELIKRFKELAGDSPSDMLKKKLAKLKTELGLFEAMELFVKVIGIKNAWTKASYDKFSALKNDLKAFNPKLEFSDLTEEGLTDFVMFLREKKKLRVPRKRRGYSANIGILNTSIAKKLTSLRQFLGWAADYGHNTNMAFRLFYPKLKKTPRKIIFLTHEEMQSLARLKFAPCQKHLEVTRDCFLFMCYSGLRWSDAFYLTTGDVKEDHIEFTTRKTADSLRVEFNDTTSAILKKYTGSDIPEFKALPVPVNQRMNMYLKTICRMARINDPVHITNYLGNERIDAVYEKWELIGTHAARRTFVTQCLSLGIPADVVMKWTGHSDYQSMKPYIDVVDAVKAREMQKLNTLKLKVG